MHIPIELLKFWKLVHYANLPNTMFLNKQKDLLK